LSSSSSIHSLEGVKSALNSTNYRLVRLESLANSILSHHHHHHSSSSLSSLLSLNSQSKKEILSFTNSCAVSHLELSSAVIEIEIQQMFAEDQFSKFRESQEYLERQFLEERRLEMSLEDERSSLFDSICFLQKRKKMLFEQKIIYVARSSSRVEKKNTDRWNATPAGHDDDELRDLILEEPPWRDDMRTSKRKRSLTINEINETKVNPPITTMSRKESEAELRRILLDRLSKKKKIDSESRSE
jgi:hypothetical protein